jgi:hypothetical protein
MKDEIFKSKPFKETLAYQGVKKLYKELTKNNIPSDPQKIFELEKRLEQEDQLKQDVEKSKSHIKEILKARKEAYKEVKRQRRTKIKRFFKKLVGAKIA